MVACQVAARGASGMVRREGGGMGTSIRALGRSVGGELGSEGCQMVSVGGGTAG